MPFTPSVGPLLTGLLERTFTARTQATATVPYFRDEFARADGPLGPGWIDGHDVLPDAYEPLGIRGGNLVCTNPMTRPGTYDTTPPSDHPPTGGRHHPGIGCAWRETGSKAVRVKGRWSGIRGIAAMAHVEFSPLVHVVPGHPLHGFGVWMSEFGGSAVMLAGYISNPSEDFAANDIAIAAIPGNPASGVTTDIELVTDGAGHVRAYVGGSGAPVNWSLHAGGTATVLDIHQDLAGSTLHGIAVDAHYTTPANVPTTPAAEWVEIETRDPGTALARTGGAVTTFTLKPGASANVWRVSEDGGGGALLGMYANDTDAQPKLSLGSFLGTPLIAAGPGGAVAPTLLAQLTAAGISMGANVALTGRVTARVTTIASSATPTVNSDSADAVTITGQTSAITSMSSGLTGTPANFQRLTYRIKDNGGARAITWGAKFASGGDALPTTTVSGKVLRVELEYDAGADIWRTVTVKQEP